MSGNTEKLDNCKKEIRSILIPFQRGCSLRKFNEEYRSMIGRRLPASDFGFTRDIEFLYSMPDVVKITPNRNGDYLLEGIADEASKHIQKMVMRQKPAKVRGPPPPRLSRAPLRSYNLPPRFRGTDLYNWGAERKEPPQRTVTNNPPQRTVSHDPIPVRKEPPPPPAPKEEVNKLSPQQEVILLVQKHNNRIALDDLFVEYKRMYNKSLSLSRYGFSSIEECLKEIPELETVRRNNVDFIVPRSGAGYLSENEVTSGISTSTPEKPSKFGFDNDSEKYYSDKIPSSLISKLQKVAEKFPMGILASEFPDYFQEITSDSLDFISLGYRCLSDLIDDIPSIFHRKPVAGSRKDYIIYPSESDVNGQLFIDHIVLNLRKILEAYPEGIKTKDLLNIYSINCKDTLHIEDLGFDNIESFLISIKNSIPLKFGSLNGERAVQLKQGYVPLPVPKDTRREPEMYKNETIPFDALIPEFAQYQPVTLPTSFDFDFVPVYVSAVVDPGHLYIQITQAGEATQNFEDLSNRIEAFFNGSQSESYTMKPIHIKEGAACIAKWPEDKHWYRAQIKSVLSLETVRVLYIDYGTTDSIPTSLLRYTKKEYMNLPVQALRCHLSYIKPPHKARQWSIEAKNRILSLCRDIALMAKLELQPDGKYSVVLCDTNGEDDVFVNDVLCKEGLAEYLVDDDIPAPASPEPAVQLEYHNLNPLQALQAQYFLKAFAAIAPSFANNEHYLILLKQVSLYCQPADPVQQSIGMPIAAPTSGPPGFNTFVPNANAFSNASALLNTYSAGTSVLEDSANRTKANISSAATSAIDHFIKAPVQKDPVFPKASENAVMGDGENDDDIFEDDDEMFQQFCQKVSLANKRFVKRVMLGDGFKIHIIVYDSTPYASSGDISQLIWNNKEADYLFRRLQIRDVDIPSKTLSEDGNEELFQQLQRLNVQGVQKVTGFKSSILLFPLNYVINVLNIFGHPSVTLRKRLKEEIDHFNPSDPYWQDYSPDTAEFDAEENTTSVTDDDKIDRLCLYDLLAMKESIGFKRKQMMSSTKSVNELHKLEFLQEKVTKRIQEVKEICKNFS